MRKTSPSFQIKEKRVYIGYNWRALPSPKPLLKQCKTSSLFLKPRLTPVSLSHTCSSKYEIKPLILTQPDTRSSKFLYNLAFHKFWYHLSYSCIIFIVMSWNCKWGVVQQSVLYRKHQHTDVYYLGVVYSNKSIGLQTTFFYLVPNIGHIKLACNYKHTKFPRGILVKSWPIYTKYFHKYLNITLVWKIC